MSNPVTNVEIEDVLSSIRRLVSEEGRPRRPATAPATERLVLSPALRVPEADEAGAGGPVERPIVLTAPAVLPTTYDAAEGNGDEGGPRPPEALLLHDSDRSDTRETATDHPEPEGESRVALSDPARASFPQDTLAGHAADDEQRAALRAAFSSDVDLEGEDDEALQDSPRLDTGFEGWVEEGEPACLTGDPEPERDTALDRKIAALEHLLHSQSEGWTPAPTAEDDAPPANATEGVAAGEATEIDVSAVVAAARGTVSEEAAEPPTARAEAFASSAAEEPLDPQELSQKPAFVRHPGHAAVDWEDHAPAGTSKPAAPRADDTSSAALPVELSEEALHAMVAEIIREELQGLLGERITRNVRKLVRREIHRVLMSQDFD